MKIMKFLHSCILIEENGKRLLIDPGNLCFVEKRLKPEDIGGVDAILITHKHADHYFPEALKKLNSIKPIKVYTNSEIGELLKKEDLQYEALKGGDKKDIAGFDVEVFDPKHGQIPYPPPMNLAFLINKRFLHAGDSFEEKPFGNVDILCLPVFVPWARLVDMLEFAKKVKPKKVIPTHDAPLKDFQLEATYRIFKEKLAELGIEFVPIGLNQKVDL